MPVLAGRLVALSNRIILPVKANPYGTRISNFLHFWIFIVLSHVTFTSPSPDKKSTTALLDCHFMISPSIPNSSSKRILFQKAVNNSSFQDLQKLFSLITSSFLNGSKVPPQGLLGFF